MTDIRKKSLLVLIFLSLWGGALLTTSCGTCADDDITYCVNVVVEGQACYNSYPPGTGHNCEIYIKYVDQHGNTKFIDGSCPSPTPCNPHCFTGKRGGGSIKIYYQCFCEDGFPAWYCTTPTMKIGPYNCNTSNSINPILDNPSSIMTCRCYGC